MHCFTHVSPAMHCRTHVSPAMHCCSHVHPAMHCCTHVSTRNSSAATVKKMSPPAVPVAWFSSHWGGREKERGIQTKGEEERREGGVEDGARGEERIWWGVE